MPRTAGRGEEPNALSLCSEVKASGGVVTVGLLGGRVLHVEPRAVGADWFSGLVGGEKGSGVVIRFAACEWLEGTPGAGGSRPGHTVRARLGDVFSDLVHRRAHVTVRTWHGDCRGVLVEVGSDFIDIQTSHGEPRRSVRRVPLHAIVAVLTGEGRWG
jgi:hypothetical protein